MNIGIVKIEFKAKSGVGLWRTFRTKLKKELQKESVRKYEILEEDVIIIKEFFKDNKVINRLWLCSYNVKVYY